MERTYHICLKETEIPQSFNSHNTLLEKEGAHISLKHRRGPLVDLRDTYLVFWYEDGKVYCSRINTARYGLDWMFFKDGHEMVECRDWEEFKEKMTQFREKGYIEN
jgi:hypothetical protein